MQRPRRRAGRDDAAPAGNAGRFAPSLVADRGATARPATSATARCSPTSTAARRAIPPRPRNGRRARTRSRRSATRSIASTSSSRARELGKRCQPALRWLSRHAADGRRPDGRAQVPAADLRAHSGVTCRLCHGIEARDQRRQRQLRLVARADRCAGAGRPGVDRGALARRSSVKCARHRAVRRLSPRLLVAGHERCRCT